MRFSMLYSGEQILSFKPCIVFYAGDSLTKFATSSLCGCEQLGVPHLKTVKNGTFFKKRIFFLRFSQKSQFSKTDYRFRKSYKA